jgi:hydroxymethylpyrimidine pyrophosphatase-like HAD family hydrolase
MLYRQWLPEAQRLTALPPDLSEVVGPIVGYINQRRQALAMAEDFSLRLPDRGAVWQRVAELLGRGFGRTANFARPVMHRLGKRLVGARQPSVIDGAMQLRHWFRMKGPPSTGFRKVHFEERAFSNLELYSYDPIFDLAGACTTPATAVLAEPLRKRYEGVAGAIEPERWLLHQLVHLDELERRSEEEPVVIHRAEAVAVQRYAAEVWFGDLAVPITGPVCAVDVDGVLETTGLGFSAIGPTGALALRALIRHGYRPVIATGRSLDEVRERCDAYRLAGGVAEYGAAAYNQITSTARELLTGEQRQALRRVRTMLSENGDVLVDPGYRLAVRAYYVAGPRREQLPAETIRRVLASCGEVRAIEGSYQTDFVAAGVDKGTGLLELVSELGVCRAHGASALELAVGDTMADAPMFNLAARAFAPAHAAPGLSSRVKIVRKPYQAGLSLAVASLIGHPPGQCRACHPPMPSANARLLRDALAAHDSGRLHRYRQILILAWRLSRWGE